MKELCKFDFEKNVMPNELEKTLSFNINNKSIFINSFQFLSSTLDSLVKSLGKADFKYLSKEFDSKVLDLAKQKKCYPYEYMTGVEKFVNIFLRFGSDLKKVIKDYHGLHLKSNVLLLADSKICKLLEDM